MSKFNNQLFTRNIFCNFTQMNCVEWWLWLWFLKGSTETKNLASKFYEAFVGNVPEEFEYENNDDTITKEESRSRILLLLHISAIILLSLEASLFLFLCISQTDSVINFGFGLPNSYGDKPHFEKKLILYEYETVIEYDYGRKILKETFPINVYDHSYGYTVNEDLRLLNLQKRFVNSRSNFKDGQIVLSNTKPPLEIEPFSEVQDFDV